MKLNIWQRAVIFFVSFPIALSGLDDLGYFAWKGWLVLLVLGAFIFGFFHEDEDEKDTNNTISRSKEARTINKPQHINNGGASMRNSNNRKNNQDNVRVQEHVFETHPTFGDYPNNGMGQAGYVNPQNQPQNQPFGIMPTQQPAFPTTMPVPAQPVTLFDQNEINRIRSQGTLKVQVHEGADLWAEYAIVRIREAVVAGTTSFVGEITFKVDPGMYHVEALSHCRRHYGIAMATILPGQTIEVDVILH